MIRIVKMHFKPDATGDFLTLFEQVKSRIGSFEGCKGVSLLRDINQPEIFFTYSLWESSNHLEAYRHSELFKTTWTRTKILFAERAEAWSVEEVAI